jgi:Flp pilus assembly protein TadG
LRRHARREQGQGVVEFALVLPFVIAVVLICLSLGKTVYAYIQLTHAANEGARLAAVDRPGSSDSDNKLADFLNREFALPHGASVDICYPTGARTVGEPVEVDVYTDASWVPFFTRDQIRATATMRIEQDTSGNGKLDSTTSFDPSTKKCQT